MTNKIQNIAINEKIWFANLGTIIRGKPDRRNWNACKEYGFISAGQTPKDVAYICKLGIGDVICAYESGSGYKTVGLIKEAAVPILQFRLEDGSTLHNLPYIDMNGDNDGGLFRNAENDAVCEYLAKVQWYDLNPNSLWIPKGGKGYYAPRNTIAKMDNDETIQAIERHFNIKFVYKEFAN